MVLETANTEQRPKYKANTGFSLTIPLDRFLNRLMCFTYFPRTVTTARMTEIDVRVTPLIISTPAFHLLVQSNKLR
jgi:hypothetical protein